MAQALTRQAPEDDVHSVVAAMYAMASHRMLPQPATLQAMVGYLEQHARLLKPEYATNVLLAAAVLQAQLPESLTEQLLRIVTDHSQQVVEHYRQ